MLMKTPAVSGGASREVLFRLGIIADPAAPQQFKKFGDAIVTEQKRISDEGAKAARALSQSWQSVFEGAAKQVEATVKRATDSAETSINRLTQTWMTARTRMGGDVSMPIAHPRMLALSSVSGLARGSGATRDVPSATAASGAAAASRVAEAASTQVARTGGGNVGKGLNNLAGGAAQLVRFAGLSGIAGEQDSSKILETLIGIEILVGGIHAAVGITKGAAALGGFGGAGVAAALMSGPAIPLIAAAAGAAVIYMGYRDAQETAEGKSRTVIEAGAGPERAGFWERTAQYNPLFDIFGSIRDPNSGPQSTGELVRGVDASADRVDSQLRARDRATQVQQEREAAGRSDKDTIVSDMNFRRDALKEQLDLQKQARQVSLDAARQRLGMAKEELGAAKDILRTRQQEAEDAKKRFQTDLEKFADLDPLERQRLKRIRGKVDAGRDLTADESRLAGQFDEFEDAASRSNRNRALAAGAGDIFTGGAARAAETQRAAQEAAAAVQRAEVLVKNQQTYVVRFEDDRSEQSLARVIEQIEQKMREVTKEARRVSKEEVQAALTRWHLDQRRGGR